MLPITTSGVPRNAKGRGSSSNLGRRLARESGKPAAAVLVILSLIGLTSFLLHTRISDDEGAGLHVVSKKAGGGGSSGGEQLGTTAGGQQASAQDRGRLAREVGQLAADLQQHQPGAATKDAAAGSRGTLVGGKGSVKAASGEQASGVAAKAAGQSADERAARAARFAERLEAARQQLATTQGASLGTAHRLNAFVSTYPPRPDPPLLDLTDAEVARRREAIQQAMVHAWSGYERYAWGHDELCPVTKKGKNGFGGLGATMVDALDTLHLMGLKEEYARAAEWVRTSMPLNASFDASVFETIIRVVGGMLAAYDMTGDTLMLQRAQQVADRILPAYDTPTRIPLNIINLATQQAKNPTWNQRASTLAEFGTHQLEFWRLSELSGNRTYAELAEATVRHLRKGWPNQGLMPLFISPKTGNFTARRISFGALGDSYYEYLLKMWVLQGRRDDMYRSMWEQAMDEMIDKLVFVSQEGLTYIAEFDRALVKHKFDHLVCFVPGMLALGVHWGAVQGPQAERYIKLAADLTHTCWQMYHRMPTGLSPEYVTFTTGGMKVGAAFNLLRPEALEAMWYMWRLTHDPRYRAWAWDIFQAFQTHCKVEAGYSGIKDVRAAAPVHDDTQQSFFLAETLKYLYLIFSDDSAFDMDVWVLNTEAHPLKISERQEQQQQQQPQPQRRWWWPPARSKGSELSNGSGSGATHSVARRRQRR